MVSESDKSNNLVWIDLEMTGLEDEHVILEIASIVTDGEPVTYTHLTLPTTPYV